jgi:hypothetical protein
VNIFLRNSITVLILSLLVSSCLGQAPLEKGRVMTWVPPYALRACKDRLNESFDGVGMKHGLSHLGLQFWNPTANGGLKFVKSFGTISDSSISGFRQWSEANDVKLMLCVYNGTSSGWDWDLAKTVFTTHREKFIDALVSETLRLKLDGVDIDFEGKGKHDEDKKAFVQFIKDLSLRLHEQGKELTVDSFAYKWNAPNQTWWTELLPHIDGLHVMGYSEIGAKASEWRSYDFIKAAAGPYASKLQIGVPSHASKWQGDELKDQLQWILNDGTMGLAIWDAQLKDPTWRKKSIWQQISKIKNQSPN